MNRSNRLIGVALAMLASLLLFVSVAERSSPPPAAELAYSEFLAALGRGEVVEVTLVGNRVTGTRDDGGRFRTYAPDDPGLVGDLIENGVEVNAQPEPGPSLLGRVLSSLLPLLLLLALFIWLMRRHAGAGAGGALAFGKSRARRVEGAKVSARFDDVAGVDEAKEELAELVQFLREPERFRNLGGVIPRGVLLSGPPGTGKTLLARAIAGEADVPFFNVSGSDFVEMFVGVGAARVRDLFAQAKACAPCIVFVDEIDAVGRRRGAGLGGGHDEREQTLNQLLVEMDGFEAGQSVIVIAATNRPDVLDPALMRPGRFDRQVVVPLPDVAGRTHILKVHMRKVPIAPDVEARVIARATPGFSGADLANLVNEAALTAARSGEIKVGMTAFERARDKLLMGSERRSMVLTESAKRLTAYHEAGHTIVGRLVPDHDPVHKVSIIPRGRALGVTLFLPEEDRTSVSKRQLESQIATLFGGRVAEELVFGPDAVTTGAQNDIERATRLARDMVTRWGFSETMGPMALGEEEGEVFLGRPVPQTRSMSEGTALRVDDEVKAIIDRNFARARHLLEAHRAVLDAMAEALVERETLDADQIETLMAGGRLGSDETLDGERHRGSSGPPSASPLPPLAPAMGRVLDVPPTARV